MPTDNEKEFAALMLNSIFSGKMTQYPKIESRHITASTMNWLENYLDRTTRCSGRVYNVLLSYKIFIEASANSLSMSPKSISNFGTFRAWLNSLPKETVKSAMGSHDELKRAAINGCSMSGGGANIQMYEAFRTLQGYGTW